MLNNLWKYKFSKRKEIRIYFICSYKVINQRGEEKKLNLKQTKYSKQNNSMT